MSEYHSVKCELRVQYESSLLEALKQLGYKPLVHDQPKSLYGYTGDERSQKAHIIIPRSQVGNASNDIGFFRETDGVYTIHVSEFDKKKWDSNFPKIVKHYATDVVRQIVQSGPYQWDQQTTNSEGVTTIRLIIKE